jgi:hypothetical protein
MLKFLSHTHNIIILNMILKRIRQGHIVCLFVGVVLVVSVIYTRAPFVESASKSGEKTHIFQ